MVFGSLTNLPFFLSQKTFSKDCSPFIIHNVILKPVYGKPNNAFRLTCAFQSVAEISKAFHQENHRGVPAPGAARVSPPAACFTVSCLLFLMISLLPRLAVRAAKSDHQLICFLIALVLSVRLWDWKLGSYFYLCNLLLVRSKYCTYYRIITPPNAVLNWKPNENPSTQNPQLDL